MWIPFCGGNRCLALSWSLPVRESATAKSHCGAEAAEFLSLFGRQGERAHIRARHQVDHIADDPSGVAVGVMA
jgi:hypothetical protein